MKRYINIIVLLLVVVFAASCRALDSDGGDDGSSVSIRLNLAMSPLDKIEVRSTDAGTAPEQAVYSLHVLVYRSGTLKTFKYFDTWDAGKSLDCMTGSSQNIYMVANMNDANSNVVGGGEFFTAENCATEELFRARVAELGSVAFDGSKGFLMYGELLGQNINQSYRQISVTLERLMAKITMSIALSQKASTMGDALKLVSYDLYSLPQKCFIAPQAADYTPQSYRDLESAFTFDGNVAEFFMLENRCGTSVTPTTPLPSGVTGDPQNQKHRLNYKPTTATYVKIKAEYTAVGKSMQNVVYTIPLGEYTPANYDIKRNTWYKYTVEVGGATNHDLETTLEMYDGRVVVDILLPDFVEGDLVADGNNGCRIGAPNEEGLTFKWGSLVGWGSAREGITSSFVCPIEYTGGNTWASCPYTLDPNGITVTDGAERIGDACRYYLGAAYRMPTNDEAKLLSQAKFTTEGTWSGSIDPESYAIYNNGALRFKISGYRYLTNGNAIDGGFSTRWTSSINSNCNGGFSFYNFRIILDLTSNNKTYAMPIRCIREPETVRIAGVEWARGNLVATGPNSCEIGSSIDEGSMFMFGSLIGWSAPRKGDAPVIEVQPADYRGGTTYTTAAYTSSGNIMSIDLGHVGIGDPCRYYLGNTWRLPTAAEFTALNNTAAEREGPFTSNSISYLRYGRDRLRFTTGIRNSVNATPLYVGTQGVYNTSTSGGGAYEAMYMSFSNSNVNILPWGRGHAVPVRCVKTTPPPPKQPVIIKGVEWTTGNLVADGPNGAKIGSETDDGLLFKFCSLIGWNSSREGANKIEIKPTEYQDTPIWTNTPYTNLYTQKANPAAGTGDPCSYYLGRNYRMPTIAEYQALNANGGISSEGIWSVNSYSYKLFSDGNLRFSAAGCRNQDDSFDPDGIALRYWTYDSSTGRQYYAFCGQGGSTGLLFVACQIYPDLSFNVRCVKDAKDQP